MGKKAESLPTQLSGGQQQRVAIARALVHEPQLLVCDEPTAALDHETGLTVMELLRKAAVRPDRAVIVVTHDNRVFHFGDRIAHMDDGRIVEVEEQGRGRGRLTTAGTDPEPLIPSMRNRDGVPTMFTKYVLPLLAVAGAAASRSSRWSQARQTPPPSRSRSSRRRRGPTGSHVDRRRGAGRGADGEHPDRRARPGRRLGGLRQDRRQGQEGDPLFRIDDRDLKAELKVREADARPPQGPAPPAGGRPPARGRPAGRGGRRGGQGQAARRRGGARPRPQALPAADDRRPATTTRTASPSTPPRPRSPGPTPTSRGSRPGPGRKTSRSPGPRSSRPQSQVESIKIELERLHRPRPGRRRGPPGQRPPRPVRRDGLEGADDRPRRRQAAARPGRHRRERRARCSQQGAEAVATLKGRPRSGSRSKFVKVEPYVIPKQSLTGDNSERVDTRVLQVDLRPARRPADRRLRRPADGRLPQGGQAHRRPGEGGSRPVRASRSPSRTHRPPSWRRRPRERRRRPRNDGRPRSLLVLLLGLLLLVLGLFFRGLGGLHAEFQDLRGRRSLADLVAEDDLHLVLAGGSDFRLMEFDRKIFRAVPCSCP